MVMAKESRKFQQFSARNSTNLNNIEHPQLGRNYKLPCFPTPTRYASAGFPRQFATKLQGSDTVWGMSGRLSPCKDTYCAVENRFLKSSHCAFNRALDVTDKSNDIPRVPKKTFLFFDQSGDGTRSFVIPKITPRNQIFSSKVAVVSNDDGPCENVAERQIITNPSLEEHWDENHLTDEECEMHEDTEEINALLYSDSDDEYDEDDEVTRTGHTTTPFATEEDCYKNKDKLIEHGSAKRHRLLEGKYKKSSFDSPMNRVAASLDDEDGVESSSNDLNSSKREKKVKIRRALEILESVVPGSQSKDSLSVIENAIVYLKRMKIEAEALGLGCLQPSFRKSVR